MGKRDYRHRESKKAKKAAKKLSPLDILAGTAMNVEVIKKKRKKKEVEEERE